MILTCPSCATRYEVDDRAFQRPHTAPDGSLGRNVRCVACGHRWFQPVQFAEDPEDLVATSPVSEPEPVVAPEPESAPEPPAAPLVTPPPAAPVVMAPRAPDPVLAAPEPEPEPEPAPAAAPIILPPAQPTVAPTPVRAPEPQTRAPRRAPPPPARSREAADAPARRGRSRILAAVIWVLVLGIVGTISVLGYQYRREIVSAWPAADSLFSFAGLEAKPLEFRNIGYQQAKEDGQDVLAVTGEIVNLSAARTVVPPVRIALLNSDQREIGHWTFSPETRVLEGRASAPFEWRLANPPAEAQHLEFRFTETGE